MNEVSIPRMGKIKMNNKNPTLKDINQKDLEKDLQKSNYLNFLNEINDKTNEVIRLELLTYLTDEEYCRLISLGKMKEIFNIEVKMPILDLENDNDNNYKYNFEIAYKVEPTEEYYRFKKQMRIENF